MTSSDDWKGDGKIVPETEERQTDREDPLYTGDQNDLDDTCNH